MKGMWIEVWIWIVQKVETSLCIQRICSWIVRVAAMSAAVRSWFQPGPAVCARFASLLLSTAMLKRGLLGGTLLPLRRLWCNWEVEGSNYYRRYQGLHLWILE